MCKIPERSCIKEPSKRATPFNISTKKILGKKYRWIRQVEGGGCRLNVDILSFALSVAGPALTETQSHDTPIWPTPDGRRLWT